MAVRTPARPPRRIRIGIRHRAAAILLAAAVLGTTAAPAQTPRELAQQVEIRRTEYGVPHIRAENLRAAGFGLAYVQLEDYGDRVVLGLIRARGEMARYFGHDSIDGDFLNRRAHARAVATYHLLDPDTRAVYDGFAAGVNYYIAMHPAEFPSWPGPAFTGHDVAARDIGTPRLGRARRLVARLLEAAADSGGVVGAVEGQASAGAPSDAYPLRPEAGRFAAAPWHPDEGSNAWAFAPSRTESGHAILVRNPHLSWGAGYYEAHVTVPGVLDFYGDFRIGGPFGVIGGFNAYLGWATTNNAPDPDEVYALDVDPARPDHYLFDGTSVPLQREEITVEFRNGPGLGRETREFWSTPLGPVVHRGGGKIYVLRAAGDGEYRSGAQFLRMMRAHSLEEWKDAMRMGARLSSNFTYADRDGNIFYVWNALTPVLPHPSGGDTAVVHATRSSQVWTRLVPFDSLPQVLNPASGYLHNENDPFHYANLEAPLDPADFPEHFPDPRLRLRSQHSLTLIRGDRELSLEDVVRLKHSMRMLLADRVKDDLVAAVRAAAPAPEVAEAIALIERWDNTVAPESRGGVLFKTWWWRYVETGDTAEATPASAGFDATPESLFRRPWTPEDPLGTPFGLADPERAAAAFTWAVAETERRFGGWDVAWGAVHRVRRGDVDVPVGGCTGDLGCFRVLWFDEAEDGKLAVRGGDGWVLAVEFGDRPRAYSILAYGESARPDSPHFDDQAAMFARGEMKPVAFTEAQIEDRLVRSYHPGEEVPTAVKATSRR